MTRRGPRCLLLLVVGLMAFSLAAEAQTPPWHSYAAKFVCGNVVRGPVAPGVDGKYKTTINIHNPHNMQDALTLGAGGPIPVQFFKKIVLAPRQGDPRLPPSCFIQEFLEHDFALSVDCGNIETQLAVSGLPSSGVLEGFVVLLVPPFQGSEAPEPPELDVTAFYTARSRAFFADIRMNGVSTWDVENVDYKQMRGQPEISLCSP